MEGKVIYIGYFDTTVRDSEFHVAAVSLLFGLFFIRKKDPPHMLLLASGLVLLFFSLSAILQISIGQIHLRGVAMPFSGFLGSFFGRMFLKFFNYFGSYLILLILLLISAFLIVQAPLLSMLEARVERRKPLERRKEIKVTEQPPKEEKKVEKSRSRKHLSFNEVGPYKLPPSPS